MSDIERIEMTIEEAKRLIALGEKAIDLSKVPLFEEVILKGYFEDEAVRLVHLYSDPNIEGSTKKLIELDMHAIGTLKRYLSTKVQIGRMAQRDLASAQEMLAEELAAAAAGEPELPEYDEDYAGNLGA